MKNLYIAAGLVAILISVVTVVEGVYLNDRWGEPGAEAAELGKRFAKVPKKIGNWEGIDMPVEKEVQQVSGAVNFVNRTYTNKVTNQVVTLWLIVGHARDIVRHTPDICYPNSGFRPDGRKLTHTVEYGEGSSGDFYTAKYQKEDSLVRQIQRVYWAWNRPDIKKWEAPESPRHHFGMVTRALYKMYFTSGVTAEEKTVADNVAADFAELMLPEIDAALFSEDFSSDSTDAESSDMAAVSSGDDESAETGEPAEE